MNECLFQLYQDAGGIVVEGSCGSLYSRAGKRSRQRNLRSNREPAIFGQRQIKTISFESDIRRKVGESNSSGRASANSILPGLGWTQPQREGGPMKYASILAAVLLLPVGMAAQSVLPSGTILPVSLDTGLKAAKAHPGQQIRATVMQNIPGTPIRRRAKVLGHVLQASSAKDGPSKLEISFDSVQVHGHMLPFKANLRAVAGFMTVEEAKMPEVMSSRAIPPDESNTTQIGGDQVYRGGGPVEEQGERVGQPTAYGVLVLPRVNPGQPCRGDLGNNGKPQAFWLFSADACGAYGLSGVRIEHAGRTNPRGKITLVRNKGKLELNEGTGLLLRIHGS